MREADLENAATARRRGAVAPQCTPSAITPPLPNSHTLNEPCIYPLSLCNETRRLMNLRAAAGGRAGSAGSAFLKGGGRGVRGRERQGSVLKRGAMRVLCAATYGGGLWRVGGNALLGWYRMGGRAAGPQGMELNQDGRASFSSSFAAPATSAKVFLWDTSTRFSSKVCVGGGAWGAKGAKRRDAHLKRFLTRQQQPRLVARGGEEGGTTGGREEKSVWRCVEGRATNTRGGGG